jgi:hypothetical protein
MEINIVAAIYLSTDALICGPELQVWITEYSPNK